MMWAYNDYGTSVARIAVLRSPHVDQPLPPYFLPREQRNYPAKPVECLPMQYTFAANTALAFAIG